MIDVPSFAPQVGAAGGFDVMRPPARSAHFYWFSSYAQRPSTFGFKLISHVYPAPVTLLILHHEHIYIRLYTSNNDLKSAPPYC